MKWWRRWWNRLWGYRHEPHQVSGNGGAAAAARAEQERKLREAVREADRRRPEVERAVDNFTAAVEDSFGWRHR